MSCIPINGSAARGGGAVGRGGHTECEVGFSESAAAAAAGANDAVTDGVTTDYEY